MCIACFGAVSCSEDPSFSSTVNHLSYYIYQVGDESLGLARCNLQSQTGCEPIYTDLMMTHHEDHDVFSFLYRDLSALSDTVFEFMETTYGRESVHSSQLHSQAIAVSGAVLSSPRLINALKAAQKTPLIVPVMISIGTGVVAIQISRWHDPSRFSAVGLRDRRGLYPELVPQLSATDPNNYKNKIVKFRLPKGHFKEPNRLPPPLSLWGNQEPQKDSSFSQSEALECLNVLYPVDHGFLQTPKRQPHKPFVPKLNPLNPAEVKRCIDSLEALSDPVLQFVYSARLEMMTGSAAYSEYQGWLLHALNASDEYAQTSSGRSSRGLSGSSHDRPHRLSYYEMIKMLAHVPVDRLLDSGLFQDQQHVDQIQSHAMLFVQYIKALDHKIKHTAIKKADLDEYWYRVRLIDYLYTELKNRLSQRQSPQRHLSLIELMRVLSRLQAASPVFFESHFDEEVIVTQKETPVAHPKWAGDQKVQVSQLEQITELVSAVIAADASLDRSRFRAALKEGLHRFQYTERRSWSPSQIGEITELVRERFQDVSRGSSSLLQGLDRELSEWSVRSLSDSAVITAGEVAHMMSANHLDFFEEITGRSEMSLTDAESALITEVLSEYDLGQGFADLYVDLYNFLEIARSTAQIYAPVDFLPIQLGSQDQKNNFFKSYETQSVDEELLAQVAQWRLRQRLAEELVNTRAEFIAMIQGKKSADELDLSTRKGIEQHPLIQALMDGDLSEPFNPDLLSYVLMDMADELWDRYDQNWFHKLGRFFSQGLHRLKYWSVIVRFEKLAHRHAKKTLVYHSVGYQIHELRARLLAVHHHYKYPDDLPVEILFELQKSRSLRALMDHDPYQLPAAHHLFTALDELTMQLRETRRLGVWFNTHH